MSWLPDYPYPHKETLRVLYEAYSERYDYYSARLGGNLTAKLSPPEYPAGYGAMKYYMGQFAEAINYLLGFSLDARKLGDWQSSDPFEDYDKYHTENYAALGIDGKAFWCTDVPLFISSRRIVEAWYTMLNDYIQFPVLPINVIATGSVSYTGTITITDWSDDNEYGGNRTIPLSHNASTPASTDYIAYFSRNQFRQGVSITGVTNQSTTYPTVGSWEVMGRLSGSAREWWETSSNTVNTWQGGTFVITMDGMQGSFSFPADIAAARSRILSYPQDNSDPRIAALNAAYRFGDIESGQLYKVSAENLPATNYKYFDPAE